MEAQAGTEKAGVIKRTLTLVYGAVCYLIFLIAALYSVGFIGDLVVPKTIDTGPADSFWVAVLIDLALAALFAVQHSVMARPAFKRWWTKMVPTAIERSTYVLLASLLLLLLYWQWRPLPQVVWDARQSVGGLVLQVLYFVGWALVFLSTFLIDHFDLFGLRQVIAGWRAREYTTPGFKMPFFYKLVRHPLMFSFLIAFWVAPFMSVGHLIFALATTGYILVGTFLEERDLLAVYGDGYRSYQQKVSMLLPLPKRVSRGPQTDPAIPAR